MTGADIIAVTLMAIGYLVGSLPVANFVARTRGAPDLRDVGDRNPGFWNSRTVLASQDSALVFVGDCAKGALPVALASAIDDRWVVAYLVGLTAMIGHAWPLFADFRGGRSVLTWVGTTVVVATVPATIAILLLIVCWAVSRRFAMAVKIAVIAFPFIQIALEDPWRTAMSGVLMSFVGLRFAMATRSTT
jgi:glycerol-3-phosphate acyltransferase PlsY